MFNWIAERFARTSGPVLERSDSRSDARFENWVDQVNAPEKRADYTELALQQRSGDLHLAGQAGLATSFSERSALGICSFFAAVRLIADLVASLPIEVQERVPGTNRWTTRFDDPLEYTLNVDPNADQVGYSCHHTRLVQLLIQGQSITQLRLSDKTGELEGLLPVHPSEVDLYDDAELGRLYRLHLEHGTVVADRSEILHLRGLSTDGLNPISPLRLFATNLSLAKGVREQAAHFFQNVPRPGLIVQSPTKLKDDAYNALKENLDTNYSGWKAGRAMLLEGNLTLKDYKMTFDEYQLLELMSANDADIGEKIFGLPSRDLKGYERAEYLEKYTLRPYLEQDDAEMTRKLTPAGQRSRFRCRRNVEDLLRTDIKTRYETYRVGVMSGFKKINEVRAALGDPPDPKGEELYLPQSVYGKPGTKPTVNPVQGANRRSRRASNEARAGALPTETAIDPRFVNVVTGVLQSLFQTEAHRATAFSKKPANWRAAVNDFYSEHRTKVAARLAPFPETSRYVLDAIGRHEQALLDLADSPDLARQASERAEGFVAEAEPLAKTLLGA